MSIYSYSLDFSMTREQLIVVLPILLSLFCFVLYWFVAQSNNIKEKFYTKHSFDEASSKHIFFTKLFGFISMGILPFVLIYIFFPEKSIDFYGISIIPETSLFSILWIIGLSALVIPLVIFSAKKPKNLINYPQVRAKVWNQKMYRLNLLGWALYLFGYEFLFRGILLFPITEELGMWIAIAINVSIYSATHIPKGLDETIGAIPLGFVLCLLTLASGTIWIAYVVHVVMAWTNSLTALKHHPEIHYSKNAK